MKIMDRAGRYLKGMFSCPSIIDLLAIGMMFLSFLPKNVAGFGFVAYSIFTGVCSFALKRERDIKNPWIFLLCFASFLSIFTHRWVKISEYDFFTEYFNSMILFEGFLYIFAGCLFIKVVVDYSRKLDLVLFCLPLAMIPVITHNVLGGRITIIVASVISTLVYLIIKRQFFHAYWAGVIGAALAFYKWGWIVMKFNCRPYVWLELLRQIKDHPVLGSGFLRTLNPENMITVPGFNGTWLGWLYRHNDFLSIGAYLGILGFIGSIGFAVWCVRKVGMTIYAIPVWTIILTATFQMTFFEADKAAICLPVIAACIVGANNRRLQDEV